jgi:hypothetical protein
MITKRIVAIALVTLVAALGGCKLGGGNDVDQRAVERWNFLIAHQAEKAYDYLSPGTRDTQTRESYAATMNNRPVKWKSVKFNHKECDADRCKVYIDVSYSVNMPGTANTQTSSTQSEIWVRVDNQWYFLPSS